MLSSREFRGPNSPINACMWSFAKYVAKVQPLVAVYESVGQAYTQGLDLLRQLHALVRDETGLDYRLYHVKHNNLAVGGVAVRKRYFWCVSRIPFGVEHPELTSTPTLWDAIGDLESLPLTWEAQLRGQVPSGWASREVAHGDLVDGHITVRGTDFLRGMDLMPVCQEWPQGANMSKMARRYYTKTGCLPESWNKTAEKFISRDFENMGFHQLTRWKADHPSRVVTGGSLGSVLHPTQFRLITHREAARIMGFPDTWKIQPLRNYSILRQTWGKGIPVTSGRWISTWVRRSIEGRPGSLVGKPLNELESEIDCSRVRLRGHQ